MATAPKTPVAEDAAKLLKKPDLLDEVVARTNLKKRDVKPAVEAAFAILADALRDGYMVNVSPLGKLRVVKAKALEGGASVMTVKLRTPKNAAIAADDA
ncbi:HU family DNA-binding protein [Yoonia sp. GPGPB17]|uniref:HU family DNA-binding protein n=1 Tax=Yoonia sp. GPGPB17 TaxID=3026147 RepID=UPI0030BC6389